MGYLIDNNGVLHTRGWDGAYRPKTGIAGKIKDNDLFGRPRIERDWLGNFKIKRNWLGEPIRSADGRFLYIHSEHDGFYGFWETIFAQLIFLALVGLVILALFLGTAAISPIALGIYFYIDPKRRYKGLLWWVWIITCLVGGITTTVMMHTYFPNSEYGGLPFILYIPLGIFGILATVDHQNRITY